MMPRYALQYEVVFNLSAGAAAHVVVRLLLCLQIILLGWKAFTVSALYMELNRPFANRLRVSSRVSGM